MSEALRTRLSVVTLTNADTQYTHDLITGCKYFSMQARTSAAVRFAFVTGKVATPTDPYMTLKADATYSTPEKASLRPESRTLYLATSSAGTVVEILEYY